MRTRAGECNARHVRDTPDALTRSSHTLPIVSSERDQTDRTVTSHNGHDPGVRKQETRLSSRPLRVASFGTPRNALEKQISFALLRCGGDP